MDVREWGIKDATPTINDFEIQVSDEFYDEVRDEDVNVRRSFVKTQFDNCEIIVKLNPAGDLDDRSSFSISPRSIDVDEKRRRVIIEF